MKAFDYALRLLGGRNYFAFELEAAVAKKFDKQEAVEAVERIREHGYLNDEKLFRDFVRWKAEDGHGEYYIREKLRLKGINKSTGEVRAAMEEEGIDIASMLEALVKKYKKMRGGQKPAAFKQACHRYLAGRGFALSDIIKILNDEVIEE